MLSLDQGMTGLFLRTVNSAYYGLPRRITSLDEAIGYLGYETVESTIFAISASKVLSKPIPAYQLEQGMLWQHSVGVAHGAQWIARSRGFPSESDAYVAGLLHDVGKLVMDLLVDRKSTWESGMEHREEHQSWIEVERLTTGHDHAEVGAVLVRTWNLPDPVVEATACHHTPAEARIAPKLTAAVHVANAAALMAGIGLGIDGLSTVLARLKPSTCARLERGRDGRPDRRHATGGGHGKERSLGKLVELVHSQCHRWSRGAASYLALPPC